jgi:hypothetical protein
MMRYYLVTISGLDEPHDGTLDTARAAAQAVASRKREAVYVYERRSRWLTLLKAVIRPGTGDERITQ